MNHAHGISDGEQIVRMYGHRTCPVVRSLGLRGLLKGVRNAPYREWETSNVEREAQVALDSAAYGEEEANTLLHVRGAGCVRGGVASANYRGTVVAAFPVDECDLVAGSLPEFLLPVYGAPKGVSVVDWLGPIRERTYRWVGPKGLVELVKSFTRWDGVLLKHYTAAKAEVARVAESLAIGKAKRRGANELVYVRSETTICFLGLFVRGKVTGRAVALQAHADQVITIRDLTPDRDPWQDPDGLLPGDSVETPVDGGEPRPVVISFVGFVQYPEGVREWPREEPEDVWRETGSYRAWLEECGNYRCEAVRRFVAELNGEPIGLAEYFAGRVLSREPDRRVAVVRVLIHERHRAQNLSSKVLDEFVEREVFARATLDGCVAVVPVDHEAGGRMCVGAGFTRAGESTSQGPTLYWRERSEIAA